MLLIFKRGLGVSIKVSELSRFVKSKDSKLIKHEIETGETQIIIGTHSLLSKKLYLIIYCSL